MFEQQCFGAIPALECARRVDFEVKFPRAIRCRVWLPFAGASKTLAAEREIAVTGR
jgi:hypothetical protein